MKKLLSLKEIRVTIDDFGISSGVNKAVENLSKTGLITHVSFMTSGDFFNEAVDIFRNTSVLRAGLHFDLIYGKASEISLLTDKNGVFNKDFVGLLCLSLLKPKAFKQAVQKELLNQIEILEKADIKPIYIDGHRHIQMIPAVFDVISKVCKDKNINKIRFVNENIAYTIWSKKGLFSALNPVNLVKYTLISTCRFFIKHKSHEYFYSLILSCQITPQILENALIPNEYNACEIMLHPAIDDSILDTKHKEYSHLSSQKRQEEYKSAIFLKKYLKD